ncbi:MAG TPA: hypothetical protein VLM40_20385, partial [Gemmata sp.]|nr:hypothetical protein [Gemmata sp.]
THVSAEAGDVNEETCPSFVHAKMNFPARSGMPTVTLHWYEGRKDGKNVLPAPELVKGEKERGEDEYAVFFKNSTWKFFNPKERNPKRRLSTVSSGSFLVGSKATLFSPDDYGADAYIVTEGGVERLTGNPETLPLNGGGDHGQKKEWVEAIKAGKPEMALSNFGYSGLLTAAFILANVAVRTGKPFTGVGEKCMAADNKDAAKYIRREYRKGWDLIGYNELA